jgi:hypothetical protein
MAIPKTPVCAPLIICLALAALLTGCQTMVHTVHDSMVSDDEDRADMVRHAIARIPSVEGCQLYVAKAPWPVQASTLRYQGDCPAGVAQGVGTAQFQIPMGKPLREAKTQLQHGLRRNGLLTGLVVEADIYPEFTPNSLTLTAYKSGTSGLSRRGPTELESLFPSEPLQMALQKARVLHDKVVAANVPTLPWADLETLIGRWHRNPERFIKAGLVERLPDDPKARGRSARVM